MKTSFVSFLALAGSFVSVLSAPAAVPVNAVAARQTTFDAGALITDLTAQVQPFLASINATAATVTPDSDQADIDAATTSITADVASIVAAVQAATAQVPTAIVALLRRQTDPTAIGTLITTLLGEISDVANSVISALGLTSALSIFSPLTSALSNLLIALDAVVQDLLVIVSQLVNSLLIGLSGALAGITL